MGRKWIALSNEDCQFAAKISRFCFVLLWLNGKKNIFLNIPKFHHTRPGNHLNNRAKNRNVNQSCISNSYSFFHLHFIYVCTPRYTAQNTPIIRFKSTGDVLPNSALLISPLSTTVHVHPHNKTSKHNTAVYNFYAWQRQRLGLLWLCVLDVKLLIAFYEVCGILG